MFYKLYSKQIVPISKKEAWFFLSDPSNLKTITPDHMGFNILAGQEDTMFPGQIIHYEVTPLLGIKTKWVTEITHVKHEEYFVDEQRFGPYTMWHHKHFIKPTNGGVIIEDVIDYKIPMSFIGSSLHAILIKKKLKEIFTYRSLKLEKIYGKIEGHLPELIFKSI